MEKRPSNDVHWEDRLPFRKTHPRTQAWGDRVLQGKDAIRGQSWGSAWWSDTAWPSTAQHSTAQPSQGPKRSRAQAACSACRQGERGARGAGRDISYTALGSVVGPGPMEVRRKAWFPSAPWPPLPCPVFLQEQKFESRPLRCQETPLASYSRPSGDKCVSIFINHSEICFPLLNRNEVCFPAHYISKWLHKYQLCFRSYICHLSTPATQKLFMISQ